MIRELIDAFKATRRPPTEADNRYVAATVRVSETIEGKVNTLNPRDYGRVGRAVTGSIWNAATIIAREAAAGEIKLYRPANGTGRRVSKSAASFLRGDGGTIRPAAKAMTYANEAEDIEEVTDHPALSLLRDPDPSTTSADFFTALYWFREVAGAAYIWTGGETPTGLFLLLPQFTRVILDDKQGVTGYHYGRNDTNTATLPTSQVVASRWMPDPFNPYLGVSWVDSIKGYGDMEDAAIASEIHRWRNSAQPGSIVRVNNYTPDQMAQLAEAMKRKGGPFEAGKVTIINGSAEDIEIIQPNSKPHELNYERGIIQCEAAIYRAAGVPEPIWKMNDAIQSNAAHGSKVWMQQIYARQKAVASDLTEWLLPMFGVEPGEMWFAYPNPVVEDVASKATLLLAGFQAGVARVNEWRAVVGLDPVDDEDNTLGRAPVAVPNLFGAMSNGQGKPAAEAETGSGEDRGGRREGGSPGSGGDGEPEDAGDESGGKGGGNASRLGRKAGAVELIHVPRWGALGCGCGCAKKAGPVDEIEANVFRAVQEWATDALTRGIAGIGADGSFDISKLASAELEGVLRASITAAFNQGAVSFIETNGIDAEPLTSQAARDYVEGYTFELVKGVTETMADQMRTVISAGLEKGQTINEIQQELTDRVPDVSLARAETIARTETARAAQNGSLTQAEELGFEAKTWSLSGNPCGLCEGAAAALGGKQVPIGEPFFRAGDTIAGTDGKMYTMARDVRAACELHPNCSCSSIEIQEASS
jgi:hypothetical protein